MRREAPLLLSAAGAGPGSPPPRPGGTPADALGVRTRAPRSSSSQSLLPFSCPPSPCRAWRAGVGGDCARVSISYLAAKTFFLSRSHSLQLLLSSEMPGQGKGQPAGVGAGRGGEGIAVLCLCKALSAGQGEGQGRGGAGGPGSAMRCPVRPYSCSHG